MPLVAKLSKRKDAVTFGAIRKSESVWYSQQLKNALDVSNAWGRVRLFPENYQQVADVNINGIIVESNGETLDLQIRATDSTGLDWFHKVYKLQVSAYTYNPDVPATNKDPFQSIFNRIANDLLIHRQQLLPAQSKNIKDITAMRFAYDLAPETFAPYLKLTKKMRYELTRLPALNDPVLQPVQRIDVRNQLFLDVVQDYYRLFAQTMQQPYQEWRANSYDSVVERRRLKVLASREKIGGALAVLGGLAATLSEDSSDSADARRAKQVLGSAAISIGAAAVKSGFQHSDEASLHTETLRELGESLEYELEPNVLEVEDKTITLTGTMQEQFQQWRELLLERYRIETGQSEIRQTETELIQENQSK